MESPNGTITVCSVGDIMPGGILNSSDRPYISDEVLALLKEADIRVGTLETAVGNEPTFNSEKMKRGCDVVYVEDKDLDRIEYLNINIVSLANNHFFDLGKEGAHHAIEELDRRGILHCGGGMNIDEASKPAVIEKKGVKIGFLAFCDWREETVGWCPIADKEKPGINPLYEDYVLSEIKKYKTQFDYIVVIPHWGTEQDHRPSREVVDLEKKIRKAGANLIIGGHTHSVQPLINRGGVTTVYSLGNFLFPDWLICPPRH